MSLLVSIHFPLNSLHYFRLLSFSNILYLAAVRLFWSPWRVGKINLNKLAAKVTNFGCYRYLPGFGRHRPFLHSPIRSRRLSLVSGHFHLIAALLFDFRYYHPISDVIARLRQFLDTSVEFWILPSDFGRSRSILNSNVRFRSRSSDFGRCRVFDLISGDYFMTVGYFSFFGNPLLNWAVLCRISNLGRNHWLRLLAYKIT